MGAAGRDACRMRAAGPHESRSSSAAAGSHQVGVGPPADPLLPLRDGGHSVVGGAAHVQPGGRGAGDRRGPRQRGSNTAALPIAWLASRARAPLNHATPPCPAPAICHAHDVRPHLEQDTAGRQTGTGGCSASHQTQRNTGAAHPAPARQPPGAPSMRSSSAPSAAWHSAHTSSASSGSGSSAHRRLAAAPLATPLAGVAPRRSRPIWPAPAHGRVGAVAGTVAWQWR